MAQSKVLIRDFGTTYIFALAEIGVLSSLACQQEAGGRAELGWC